MTVLFILAVLIFIAGIIWAVKEYYVPLWLTYSFLAVCFLFAAVYLINLFL